MNSDETYRKNLERLLDSKHFVPAEETWQNTRHYIDSRNKKRKRLFVLFTTAGLLLLSFLFGLLNFTGEFSLATKVTPSKTSSQSQTEKTKKNKLVGQAAQKHRASKSSDTSVPNRQVATIQKSAKSRRILYTKAKESEGTDVAIIPSIPVSPEAPQENQGYSANYNPDQLAAPETDLSTPDTTELAQDLFSKSGSLPETETVPALVPQTRDSIMPQLSGARTNDTIPAITLSPVADTLKSEPAGIPACISLEAGVSYLGDMKKIMPFDNVNLNPVIGLSFHKYITRNKNLGLGLVYTRVAALQPSPVVSQSVLYSYGEESTVTAITPERLHYLGVPFRLGWRIKPRQVVSIGYTILYLFDVEARVEKYNIQMNTPANYSSYRSGGYTEGFRIFESQISLLYRLKINKVFSAQSELVFGLTDIKENNFFKLNRFDRNAGVKLTLVYDLLNIK